MNNVDRQYLDLLKHILNTGIEKNDRTGTGTISIFDYTMRINMSEGFPLLTSKKMFTKGIIHEMIWFLKGLTNIKYLVDNDVHIWDGDCYKSYQGKQTKCFPCPPDGNLSKEEFINKIKTDDEFAKKWGDLGPVYGKQWRDWDGYIEKYQENESYGGSFGGPTHVVFKEIKEYYVKGVDQIANLIKDLKTNPDSRRLMVTAWNPSDLDSSVLPPCHYGFQCYTQEMNTFERKEYWCNSIGKNISYSEDFGDSELDTIGVPKRKLSLKWNQRSVDTFLGLSFNIASYGLLLHLLAREVNMVPNELIFSGGDVHLYLNHINQAKEQLSRQTFDLPKLILTNKSLDGLKYEDVQIIDYKSSPVIKGELSN